MKKMAYPTIMRKIAGACYFILCIYQMFSLRYVLNNNTMMLTTLPVAWFIEILLMLLAGGLCAWMMVSDEKPTPAARTCIGVVTALVVVFELATYPVQSELVGYSATLLFPSIGGNEIWNYIFMIFRSALWILGLFFVLNTKEDPEDEEGEEKAKAKGKQQEDELYEEYEEYGEEYGQDLEEDDSEEEPEEEEEPQDEPEAEPEKEEEKTDETSEEDKEESNPAEAEEEQPQAEEEPAETEDKEEPAKEEKQQQTPKQSGGKKKNKRKKKK